MTKEEFTSYIKRHCYTELEDGSIDIYWNFYNTIPVNGSEYYEAEKYHIARDLHEWNLISMIIEPVVLNNIYKGRKMYFYRTC